LIDQGFDPKPKLLSERLGVSEREIVDMDQRLDSWDVSLDAPLKNDSETERIEFLSTDSESVEEQVSKKEIELLLHNKISEFRKKMTPREIEIFELRIFSDTPSPCRRSVTATESHENESGRSRRTSSGKCVNSST